MGGVPGATDAEQVGLDGRPDLRADRSNWTGAAAKDGQGAGPSAPALFAAAVGRCLGIL